ncbi:MAG: carbohydrate ABC transporter permease, partial [Clostridia bacterium]|nr:carbohydrate ABC transporter permease [Clostridia bacterium]
MSYQLNKVNPRNFHKTQVKFYLILIPIGLFMILPVLYILNHAFKPLDELFMFPPRFIVQKPTMNNFEMLWQTASTTGVPMSRYLFNSIIVSILAVLGNIVFIAMAGFALSKKKFRLKKTLFEINQLA